MTLGIDREIPITRCPQITPMRARGIATITTSGSSANVVKAVEKAREMGIQVVGLTGARGELFARSCDLGLVVPSDDVARIQESHICAGHLICQLVESTLFGDLSG